MSWAEVLGVWTPVNKPAGVSSGGHDRTPWRLVNVEADSPTAQHLGPRKTGVGEEHGRASICAKDPQLQGPQGPLQLPRHGLLRSLVGCLRSLRRGCAWAGKSGTFQPRVRRQSERPLEGAAAEPCLAVHRWICIHCTHRHTCRDCGVSRARASAAISACSARASP